MVSSHYSVSTKIQLLLTFTVLFIGLSVLALMNTATADETGTRSGAFEHTPTDVALATLVSSAPTEYISPEFTAQFPFNGIGLTWSGSVTDGVDFALQIDDGEWYNLELQGNDAKDQTESFVTAPLFVEGQRVRYKITGEHREAVRNVEMIYFDSTVPPYHSLANTLKNSFGRSIQSSTDVISRSEWGADESYRTWEAEYETPDKILIHHTAGGDGGNDPAATIRGIYYWHAVVLGWGDIGYNYIIDPEGNIYEGRAGGDAVIGAHTYNSDTDTNYNVGSVGVALLGCYEQSEDACNTVYTMTASMQSALEQLIAEKSALFDFSPTGESTWYGEQLPNVLGHRDIDSTYCPGSTVHDQLDTIRTNAYQLYSTVQVRPYAASYNSSTIAASYPAAATADLSLLYANTGTKNWNKDKVVLQVKLVETGERNRFTLSNSVEDGSIAAITGSLTLPTKPGSYTLATRLYRNGSPIHGSKYQTSITVENPYQVNVTKAELPLAIQQGWQPTLQLTIKNTGNTTVPAGSTIQVDGETVATLAKDLKVGSKTSLQGKVLSATTWSVGSHSAIAKLKIDSVTAVGSRQVRVVRVDPAE